MPSPNASDTPDMPEALRGVLHQRRVAALVADAEFIRDQPDSGDKIEEAKRHIREAMLLYALRRITRAERDRLLAILSFVTVHEALPKPDRPPHPYFDDPDLHGPLV